MLQMGDIGRRRAAVDRRLVIRRGIGANTGHKQ
jgi:hypothetical protein